MSWLLDLHLISMFGLYLALMFVLSILLRIRQYLTVIQLVRAASGRWPHLFRLIRTHQGIFLSWETILPFVLSLSLILINWLASSLIWPSAEQTLTGRALAEMWLALPVVLSLAGLMVAIDFVTVFQVVEIDRKLLEGYFDQAEFWLRSWTAPVVRVFSLGFINPRKIVHAEVRKALVDVSKLLNSALWWVSMQAGVRFLCGLSLYVTYLLEPWLRGGGAAA